jgi:hemolysin activation/secretion protein
MLVRIAATLLPPIFAAVLLYPHNAAAQAATGDAPVRHFAIEEYRVEGNTVLPDDAIESAVYPFLGPDRTADDVEKARAALDSLYAARGYPTVSAEIPLQDGAGGVIVLKVTERKIGRLRVRGAQYFSPREIREAASAVAEGKVPNMTVLGKQIVAMNQWPDRTVTPLIRPGIAPNTVDVDLNVKDTLPLHASVEVNNRANADTTPLRTLATISYGNFWQRGDSASISYQTAPMRSSDAAIASASYLYRIPNSTASLLVSYVKSDSNISTVGNSDVVGRGTIIGTRLQMPIRQDAVFNSSVSLGFDYKHFDDATIQGGDRTPAPVTYVPLSLNWTGSWARGDAETNMSATVVMGTRGIGTGAATFDEKRYLAKPNFAYVRWDIGNVQPLPMGAQFFVRTAGQLAAEPLISNEQFAAGGADTVRGFLESETLGDYGAILQTELRSPKVGDLVPWMSDTRAVIFADQGMVGLRNALVQQRDHYGLASAGAGIRLRAFDTIVADVYGAHTVTAGTTTKSSDTRMLFRLNGAF